VYSFFDEPTMRRDYCPAFLKRLMRARDAFCLRELPR
jgi:hypothetical protein